MHHRELYDEPPRYRFIAVIVGCAAACCLSGPVQSKERHRFLIPSGVTNCALSKDGKLYAVNTVRHEVLIWETDGFRELRRFQCDDNSRHVNFTEDGKRLLVASYVDGTTALRWYDVAKGDVVREASLAGLVECLWHDRVAILKHYPLPATRQTIPNANITVRDLAQEKDYPLPTRLGSIAYSPFKNRYSFELTPDGKHVMWIDKAGWAFVFDYKKGKEIWRLPVLDGTDNVDCLPDGKTMLTQRSPFCTFWDLQTGKKIGSDRVLRYRFLMPDGKRCVWYSENEWIFSDLDGKENARLPLKRTPGQQFRVLFTPDQRFLIAASGSEIRVWDVPKPK